MGNDIADTGATTSNYVIQGHVSRAQDSAAPDAVGAFAAFVNGIG